MPEGNEVHRFRDRQAEVFVGKAVQVDSPNGRFPDAALLDGRRLQGIIAHGKHLGYDFGKNTMLHVHLGRFGDFTEGTMPLATPKGVLRLRMWNRTDWLELRGATDITVYDQARWTKLLARLGPDPLEKGADPGAAFQKIGERSTPLGALLMDQAVIAGIGNIYRAELLYRARISPFRAGEDVMPSELQGIWRDAVTLMAEGMVDRRIVTTRAKDRPHPRGNALDEEVHYVYRRARKPCWVCGTRIESKTMVGRTLYWCPVCQKN